jgi:hypothetical protein
MLLRFGLAWYAMLWWRGAEAMGEGQQDSVSLMPQQSALIDNIVAAKDTILMSGYAHLKSEPSSDKPSSRSRMFDALVANDDDLIGLVAYALYKQSKRDWLKAFEEEKERSPTSEEIQSYIIGECTARRIETYRRLGADALVRLRPQTATPMSSQNASRSDTQPLASQSEPPAPVSRSWIKQVAVIVVGMVAGVALIRFGMPVMR